MLTVTDECVCEFTLALNNATGKYFFCQDMIKASLDIISRTYYWRVPLRAKPIRVISRILGRLALIEVRLRMQFPRSSYIMPLISRTRPVVFTDPRECILYKIKPSDIILCHDLGPVTHPELYDRGVETLYRTVFENIERVKPLMLFVSKASRSAFIERYGDQYPLMDIVYPPIRTGINSEALVVIPGIPKRFVLTVGSIGTRKNHKRVIEAFALSGLYKEGFNYVLSGGNEPGFEEALDLAKRTPGVIVTGYVSDQELCWLYNNASGFILPSLLEGFGLPAAEAVQWGLIPLIGQTGALYEVAGEGAVLVEPLDVVDIARGMRELAHMESSERERRLQLLRKSIDRFSLDAAVSVWRGALQKASRSNQRA